MKSTIFAILLTVAFSAFANPSPIQKAKSVKDLRPTPVDASATTEKPQDGALVLPKDVPALKKKENCEDKLTADGKVTPTCSITVWDPSEEKDKKKKK